MALSTKRSIIGGVFVFILATSCCWLPAILIALGGAGGWIAFSENLENFSNLFLAIGVGLCAYGGYQYYTRMKKPDLILKSIITCPVCGFAKSETMPTNACQYYYECEQCKTVLKPNQGDCCVYCSFGTVKCPPVQSGDDCCT